MSGRSLAEHLKVFGPMSEEVMKKFLRQLLDALAYCHSHGIIHRDIKGKNILVGAGGVLKLCDFGSAKLMLDKTHANPTMNYGFTPLWLAPEFMTGAYNSKVDIWSLGCVCIEMASGKDPWSEMKFGHPFQALHHIGNSGEIPALPTELSAEGQQFVRLMLTRDPAQRPSAAQLLSHPYPLSASRCAATMPTSERWTGARSLLMLLLLVSVLLARLSVYMCSVSRRNACNETLCSLGLSLECLHLFSGRPSGRSTEH